jgi:hypothetical protein
MLDVDGRCREILLPPTAAITPLNNPVRQLLDTSGLPYRLGLPSPDAPAVPVHQG